MWWKHRLWRIARDSLPTKENLFKRTILQISCSLCKFSKKIIFHVIKDCPFARSVWFAVIGMHSDQIIWNEPFWTCLNLLIIWP